MDSEREGGEALAIHVISVHSLIGESTLRSQSVGLADLAPAAIAARVTGLSLTEVINRLDNGSSIGQIIADDGVSLSHAQTGPAGATLRTPKLTPGLPEDGQEGTPEANTTPSAPGAVSV